jgi:thiol:disulfide interchange protein DsbD
LADLARRERREVAVHTAAYTLGVLATLLTLGGIVAILRSAGIAVGWGFQFQEPLFIATMATMLAIFALNLFGVFEIPFQGGQLASVGSRVAGARRSFFEGLLVVVLATPCSAPFLGTATGFAFASPTPVILAIFAAIGLGLAAPYAAIAMVPGWTRFLPRSGEWMLRLRSSLGFVLLGVCVWLVWLFGRTAGSDGMVALLSLLLAVCAGVWWIASFPSHGPRRRAQLATAVLVMVTAAGLVGMRQAFDSTSAAVDRVFGGWSPYDPADIEESLAEGRTVFVAFTADWCITCKLNERQVLTSDEVREAFSRRNVALFVADWTRRDDAIRAELARFGRAGVPLYLAYHPQDPDHPQVLPELLRIDDVIGAISSHSPRLALRPLAIAKPVIED